MKHIALVLIAASLGYVAGQKTPTSEDVGVVVPAVVTPEVNDNTPDVIVPPVETPLVEKLLPKPATVKQSLTVQDGQLSPRGNFRYDPARNIWVPVDKGNRRYTHGGRPVGAAHLIEHGHHPSAVAKWTQAEREIAHANDHALLGETRSANVLQESTFSNTCPNGQCGNPGRSRGLFRWR